MRYQLFDDVHAVAQEHVLHAVEAVEDARQHAFLEPIQPAEEDALPRLEDRIAQAEELLVGDAAVFQRVGVLRPAQRQEWPGVLPGILDQRGRRGVVPGRVQRVDLQRQEVQAHALPDLGQDGLRDGVHRIGETGRELHLEDRAPLPSLQLQPLLADRQTRRSRRPAPRV